MKTRRLLWLLVSLAVAPALARAQDACPPGGDPTEGPARTCISFAGYPTSTLSGFTPNLRELLIDTTRKGIVVGDGLTDGGIVIPTLAEIIAGFQLLSSDLTAIDALTTTAFGRGLLDDADATAGRTSLGLVPGTDVQAFDPDLSLFGAITPSANVQSLLGAADYAAFRSQLSLGALALLNTVGTPQIDNDAVTVGKMADLQTDRLLGRDTAGTGDPEALTVGGGVEFTGSGGIQRSALTGDVTASAGSGSTTVADGAVSYAKIQDVSAPDRLLGRVSASAGDIEEIEITDFVQTILNDADAATVRTTIGAQPSDGDLTTLSGLTAVRGSLIRGSSAPAWEALALGASGTVFYSDGTDAAWSATPTLTRLTALIGNIGTVSSDGVILSNTTAAADGAQQWSPRIHWTGRGWKTAATAGSQAVDFITELKPVQATTSPIANLVWSSQINGGSYIPALSLAYSSQANGGRGTTVTISNDTSDLAQSSSMTMVGAQGNSVTFFQSGPSSDGSSGFVASSFNLALSNANAGFVIRDTSTERFRFQRDGAFSVTAAAGKNNAINATTSLTAATGNETAFTMAFTTNKATSGNDTGLRLLMTDTASPGTSQPFQVDVGAATVMAIRNNGDFYTDNSEIHVRSAFTGRINLRMGNGEAGFISRGGVDAVVGAGTDHNIRLVRSYDASASSVWLAVSANDVLEMRRTTNAQTFILNGTHTDSSNRCYGSLAASATGLTISANTAGTCADDQNMTYTPTGIGGNLYGAFFSQWTEMTAPAAPAANSVRIYAVDNGAGKTQLMAVFGSGAAQQLAIEP